METQFKIVLSDPKLGTIRRVTSLEPEPWNVPEAVRDHFRRVRSTLNRTGGQGFCVAVCSSCRGEGVSWVTAMLTCAMAEENESVLLIDYNRAHPSQGRIFRVDQDPGIPITQSEPVDLVSRRAPRYDISLLTPEATSSNEEELGCSLRAALPKLRQKSKFILIDCEPMRDSSQLLDLAPAIDGVILVVQAERERREVVAHNLESIRRTGSQIFGIVLNKRKRYIPGWLYRLL